MSLYYSSWIFLDVYVSMFLPEYMPYVCSVGKNRRGCRIPWSQNFRQLWAKWPGCWEQNSDPLEEQYVVLTIGPSLQPLHPALYRSSGNLNSCPHISTPSTLLIGPSLQPQYFNFSKLCLHVTIISNFRNNYYLILEEKTTIKKFFIFMRLLF